MNVNIPSLLPWQCPVLQRTKRFGIVNAGRRSGKTQLGIIATVLTMWKGLPCGWFAPNFPTLQTAMDDFERMLYPVIRRFNRSTKYLQLHNGGSVEFVSLSKRLIARGRKYAHVVLDECAYEPRLMDHWEASIRPALTDYAGKGLLLSTPQGRRNEFYTLCELARNDPKYQREYQYFHATQFDNPTLPEDERANNAERSDPKARQEYWAEFLDEQTLGIPPDLLKELTGTIESKPVVFGIDLGRECTAIVGLSSDGKIAHHDSFPGTWSHIRSKILGTVGNTPTLIDSTGVGSVVLDELTKERRNIEGFVFNEQSRRDLLNSLVHMVLEKKVKLIPQLSEQLGRVEIVGDSYEAPRPNDGLFALALAVKLWRTRISPTIIRIGR